MYHYEMSDIREALRRRREEAEEQAVPDLIEPATPRLLPSPPVTPGALGMLRGQRWATRPPLHQGALAGVPEGAVPEGSRIRTAEYRVGRDDGPPAIRTMEFRRGRDDAPPGARGLPESVEEVIRQQEASRAEVVPGSLPEAVEGARRRFTGAMDEGVRQQKEDQLSRPRYATPSTEDQMEAARRAVRELEVGRAVGPAREAIEGMGRRLGASTPPPPASGTADLESAVGQRITRPPVIELPAQEFWSNEEIARRELGAPRPAQGATAQRQPTPPAPPGATGPLPPVPEADRLATQRWADNLRASVNTDPRLGPTSNRANGLFSERAMAGNQGARDREAMSAALGQMASGAQGGDAEGTDEQVRQDMIQKILSGEGPSTLDRQLNLINRNRRVQGIGRIAAGLLAVPGRLSPDSSRIGVDNTDALRAISQEGARRQGDREARLRALLTSQQMADRAQAAERSAGLTGRGQDIVRERNLGTERYRQGHLENQQQNIASQDEARRVQSQVRTMEALATQARQDPNSPISESLRRQALGILGGIASDERLAGRVEPLMAELGQGGISGEAAARIIAQYAPMSRTFLTRNQTRGLGGGGGGGGGRGGGGGGLNAQVLIDEINRREAAGTYSPEMAQSWRQAVANARPRELERMVNREFGAAGLDLRQRTRMWGSGDVSPEWVRPPNSNVRVSQERMNELQDYESVNDRVQSRVRTALSALRGIEGATRDPETGRAGRPDMLPGMWATGESVYHDITGGSSPDMIRLRNVIDELIPLMGQQQDLGVLQVAEQERLQAMLGSVDASLLLPRNRTTMITRLTEIATNTERDLLRSMRRGGFVRPGATGTEDPAPRGRVSVTSRNEPAPPPDQDIASVVDDFDAGED